MARDHFGLTPTDWALPQHYVEARDWWENQGIPGLQDRALPDDLLGDFKQMVVADAVSDERAEA